MTVSSLGGTNVSARHCPLCSAGTHMVGRFEFATPSKETNGNNVTIFIAATPYSGDV